MSLSPSSPSEGNVVYTCRVFTVREGDVRMPNGQVFRQSWLDHAPCIAVVPVLNDGRFLLIRQYRHAARQVLIEIPAGRVHAGVESIEDCVQREMAEEVGYRAQTLVKLYEGFLAPGYSSEYMYYYLAENLIAAPLPPDEDEDIEVLAVTPEEAQAMISDGRILDSKTALGVGMAMAFLGRKQGG